MAYHCLPGFNGELRLSYCSNGDLDSHFKLLLNRIILIQRTALIYFLFFLFILLLLFFFVGGGANQ